MSPTQFSIEQTDPPRSPKETLPTMYDLPSEAVEEAGLPDEFHLWQAELSSATFCPPNYPNDRIVVASDLNLYYDPRNPNWYKRPDWFAVVGIPRLYEERDLRLSYVIWQEGVRPSVAIEFLSPSTRAEDLGETERQVTPPSKWEVYEQILAVPYYVVFDRLTDEMQVFRLEGKHYRPLELPQSRVWLPELNLGLGLWLGTYRGVRRQWLRWFDSQGNWIPTPDERTEGERQRAERERQRAERERQEKETAQELLERERQEKEAAQQRAEQLAERLRQAGINPDDIS
ncbi:MAG: Uma2 family endonuclease [Cyanobacteriota bacterium]|nr:Uma2 family endonuclease [Cyanobacteriota bacterium]